jgi:hypothetical protein
MPEILAFHAKYRIAGTDKVVQVDMDDYYEDTEILEKLKQAFSASTVQELLQKIKRPRAQSNTPGLIRASIKKCKGENTKVLNPADKL